MNVKKKSKSLHTSIRLKDLDEDVDLGVREEVGDDH